MTTNRLLHIPEGVRDIYNSECERKLLLENELMKLIRSFGFADIQTPSFEFFEVYSKERGSVDSKHMYKFFDREGNTLVLRPDMTPSIARCVAKYYKDETMPIRLCYDANTYLNNSEYQGKLKETTQLGAELVNAGGVDADAEIIALTVECLLKAGLSEFQVEIGMVSFFRALVEEAGLDEDETEELRLMIINKNIFGVEKLVETKNISDNLKKAILKLPELFGNINMLKEVEKMELNEKAIKTIEHLEQLYDLLKLYGVDKYITFDLGALSEYNYYTGITFHAYTYGTGNPVISGGRYDSLLGQFGKEAPAIGMAVLVNQLMAAMASQKISISRKRKNVLVIYSEDKKAEAVAYAKKEREAGIRCTLMTLETAKDRYDDYMKRFSIDEAVEIK